MHLGVPQNLSTRRYRYIPVWYLGMNDMLCLPAPRGVSERPPPRYHTTYTRSKAEERPCRRPERARGRAPPRPARLRAARARGAWLRGLHAGSRDSLVAAATLARSARRIALRRSLDLRQLAGVACVRRPDVVLADALGAVEQLGHRRKAMHNGAAA